MWIPWNFSLCKDNDPDVNFYLENSSCEYYTEDSFNNMLAENQSRQNLKCSTLETGLSLLRMNIHSGALARAQRAPADHHG